MMVMVGLVVPLANAQEDGVVRTFMIVWSYQDATNRGRTSHVFATFFLMNGNRLGQKFTISWLPQRQYMKGRSGLKMPLFGVVPGQLYSLSETLGFAEALGEPVTRSGPYEITIQGYNRAVTQLNHLQSGRVAYKFLDRSSRPEALNCIHSVSDVAGQLRTGALRGDEAADFVVGHFGQRGVLRNNQQDLGLYNSIRQHLAQP